MQARIEWKFKKMKKKIKEVKIFKEMHPRSATFKSRHRSSRGTSTLYNRLRVSNHLNNLFLTSNENLIPTSYTFSEFLSANFRENSENFLDFDENALKSYLFFFACFKLLTRCTTSTSKKKLSTVRELSLSAFERC